MFFAINGVERPVVRERVNKAGKLDKAEEIVGVVLPTNEDPATRRTIGLNYFARSPESEVWVVFRDLPAPTRDRLRARIAAGDAPADDGWLDGPATR
jgi:hypothetical protein